MTVKLVERIWVIYVFLLITVMCFGVGYHFIFGDPFTGNLSGLKWMMGCLMFGIPPNLGFLIMLTAFSEYLKK